MSKMDDLEKRVEDMEQNLKELIEDNIEIDEEQKLTTDGDSVEASENKNENPAI